MHYLYKKKLSSSNLRLFDSDFLNSCEIKTFFPKILHLRASYEHIGLKTIISRLQFLFSSKGRFRIYHLCIGDSVVHTAYVVPVCKKFDFLKECDIEIGPCFTELQFRRKGAYQYMLTKILEKEASDNGFAYMIVSDTNVASINGIESVGFNFVGTVKQEGLFKNYRLET